MFIQGFIFYFFLSEPYSNISCLLFRPTLSISPNTREEMNADYFLASPFNAFAHINVKNPLKFQYVIPTCIGRRRNQLSKLLGLD